MKIHHLNCGTLCPYGGKLINRSPAKVVCHCLLIETNDGLVLVDSGLGLRDIENPKRLGWVRHIIKPKIAVEDSAIYQIKKLGFSPADLKHIVVTHLDVDHAGGLSDFPDANVHVFAPEFSASQKPSTYFDRQRYRMSHFEHKPKWLVHESNHGEKWFGFDCVRELKGLPPEILLIPLEGHSKGHCGVAVKSGDKWLLHAGDSYYDYRQMDLENPQCSFGLRAFQKIVHDNDNKVRKNLIRLRGLSKAHSDEITIFSAHDPTEFEKLSETKL